MEKAKIAKIEAQQSEVAQKHRIEESYRSGLRILQRLEFPSDSIDGRGGEEALYTKKGNRFL